MSAPIDLFKEKLMTRQMQYAIPKTYKEFNKHAFKITSLNTGMLDAENAEEINKIKTKLNDLVKNHISKFNFIIKQGSDELAQQGLEKCIYEPEEYEFEYNCPTSKLFFQAAIKLDEVIQITDTLWLHGLIDDMQRAEKVDQAQQYPFVILHTARRLKKDMMMVMKKAAEGDSETTQEESS